MFTVDKEKLARIVPVYDGISLNDMEEAVAREFGIYEDLGVSLSYWSPCSLTFVTGKKTPPVMVTTAVGLAYFLKLARQKKGLNLFVKFKSVCKRGNGCEEGGASNGVTAKRRCVTEDVVPENISAVSKAMPFVGLDSEELLAEVLAEESGIGGKRGPIVSEAGTDCRCDGSVERSSGEDFEVGVEDLTEDYEITKMGLRRRR